MKKPRQHEIAAVPPEPTLAAAAKTEPTPQKKRRPPSPHSAHAKRVARQTEKMRASIIKAARDLITEFGCEAVTLRQIAEKVGCSAPALLNHYPNKQILLLAVQAHDVLALQAAFQQMTAAVSDPLEKIVLLSQSLVTFAQKEPNQYRLVHMTQLPVVAPSELHVHGMEHGNPELDPYFFARELWRELISAGRVRPEYTDPDLITQAFWGAVHGVISLFLIKQQEPWFDWKPMPSLVDFLVSNLLRSVLVEQPAQGKTRKKS